MKLIWKLLRQHISIPQFAGFFLANLVGMVIIMLGVQIYVDVTSVYDDEDSFMKADYLIINKKIGVVDAFSANASSFSQDEIKELKTQPFVKRIGWFCPSEFNVRASFDVQQFSRFSTDMFFESVDNYFVDVKSEEWSYAEGQKQIPIILPRDYLDLYNFGFAQSRSLPKLSEGLLSTLRLGITIQGENNGDEYEGKIVGFSSRLNTILVPQTFMDYANKTYAKKKEVAKDERQIQRLIVEVTNPTDERIAQYLEEHGWETDQDKLDQSKTTFMLKMFTGIVMSVGLIISLLSIYILMLSVYLLVEKNNTKLENLLLIGYSPRRVASPYQLLTIGLNIAVLILAIIITSIVRHFYTDMLCSMFPEAEIPTILPTIITGLALLVVVSTTNVIAVYNKVKNIWNRNN